jgi:hypothetical protein
MTFLVAQMHVFIALWMLYTQENKTKPKTHYKCISVMVHVIKFRPKNKTTKFFFFQSDIASKVGWT